MGSKQQPSLISPQELSSHILSPNWKIIDVREADYSKGKIKNSIHVPYWSISQNISKLQGEVSEAENVVFHCHFSKMRGPDAAQQFCRQLTSTGVVKNVFILEGGWAAWMNLYGKKSSLTDPIEAKA